MRICDKCGGKADKSMKHTIEDKGTEQFATTKDICDTCYNVYIISLKQFAENFFSKDHAVPSNDHKEAPLQKPSTDQLFAKWYKNYRDANPAPTFAQISHDAWYDGLLTGLRPDPEVPGNNHKSEMLFDYWWANVMINPDALKSKKELAEIAWIDALRYNS